MAENMPIPESVIFFALPSVPFATGFLKGAQFFADYSDATLDVIEKAGYFGIAPELAYGAQIPFGVVYRVERTARDAQGKRFFECRALYPARFDLKASETRNGFWHVRWHLFRPQALTHEQAQTLEFKMLYGMLALLFRSFLKSRRSSESYPEILRCEATRYVLKNLKPAAKLDSLEPLLNCMMDIVSMFMMPAANANGTRADTVRRFLLRAGFRFSSTRSIFRRIAVALYVLCVFCHEPDAIHEQPR